MVSRTPKPPYLKNDVNSLQFSCSVSCSSCFVPINFVFSLAFDTLCCSHSRVNEAPTSYTAGHSITGAVQQDLVPPSRATPSMQTNCSENFVFTLIKEKWMLWFLELILIFVLALIIWQYCWSVRPRICHQRHFTLKWLINISSQDLRKVK